MPATFKVNQGSIPTRREMHDGEDHLVVPVVMAQHGVMNGAYISADELSASVNSWNGRPVPVLHPKQNGAHISANSPDILERTVGKVFNAHMDGGKLKGEVWINTRKANELGHNVMLSTLESGTPGMEVSTGYFHRQSDEPGECNGVQYNCIQYDLKPDHLALLPGQIGACSWEDGCGIRVNEKKNESGKLRAAMNTIASYLGLSTHQGEMEMPKQEDHQYQLSANEVLSSDEIEALESIAQDRDKRAMAWALLDSKRDQEFERQHLRELQELNTNTEANNQQEGNMPDAGNEEAVEPATNSGTVYQVNEQELDKLVAQRMERQNVMQQIQSNADNAFTPEQLQGMDTEALKTYEQSIRPVDYTGAGGVAVNTAANADVTPLIPGRRNNQQEG